MRDGKYDETREEIRQKGQISPFTDANKGDFPPRVIFTGRYYLFLEDGEGKNTGKRMGEERTAWQSNITKMNQLHYTSRGDLCSRALLLQAFITRSGKLRIKKKAGKERE